ncbi:MAG TPA: hypothetical protein VGC63_08520 [Solirubrobacterales bacterium]|jgi:hypothetical protein
MVRQAHTYLAGAVSGTALIAAAVVAFVLLVSLQAIKDWPLAGIGGGSDGSAVSAGRPAAPANAAAHAAGGVGATAAGRAGSVANGNGRQGGNFAGEGRQQVAAATTGSPSSPQAGSPVGEAPASNPRSDGGAADPPGQSTSPGSGGGGAGSGGPVSLPGTGSSAGSGQSTSGAVTGAVNDTVSGADQAAGGTLGDAGVTKATEEVVNGVAGPESSAGEIVDKVGETVGGLLPGKR